MAGNISASTMKRRKLEQENMLSTSASSWELHWISVLWRHPQCSFLEFSTVNLETKITAITKITLKSRITYCSSLMYSHSFQ